MKSKIQLFTFIFVSSILTGAPSMAVFKDATIQKALDRQEQTSQNLIRVEGPLSCNLGENNTGQSCELMIRDQKTGRVFMLSKNNIAMRLYMQGARAVLVEGKLEASNTIAVGKVSAL